MIVDKGLIYPDLGKVENNIPCWESGKNVMEYINMKKCDHVWESVIEQYCGGRRFVTKCKKCGSIKL